MFERFTDRARRVIVLGQEQARELNHNYIGTEHMLLGLLREGDGVAARVLRELSVTTDDVLADVKKRIGLGAAPQTGHIPHSPRAKKALELALREALQLGHNYIGTEHLLLGLVREGEGVGAAILKDCGLELNQVRQAVIQNLASYQGLTGPGDVSKGLAGIAENLSRFVGQSAGVAVSGLLETFAVNSESEQPVGEYPHLPTVARAYKAVDQVADELRGLKAANAELQREVVALQAKLDDAKAETANIYPALSAAETKCCWYAKELSEMKSALTEADSALDDARDSLSDAGIRVVELAEEVDGLNAVIDKRDATIAALRAEGDTWLGKAVVKP